MEAKKIVLLGATGSIGTSTLQVIRSNPKKLKLVGIANGSQAKALDEIGDEFQVKHRVCYARDGKQALMDLAVLPEADILVVAATGVIGLEPTLAAIHAGKTIALASKEILVMAGRFVMESARQKGVKILPVDSEHNAIFQCLQGSTGKDIRRLILTASGGAFRDMDYEAMKLVTPEQALKHPNWNMGPKITVDSASMANKGLEMIEARWLFAVEPDQISAVIHPQSIVHSMVEYVDGSILAQLSPPSMTFPIQHSLLYPERHPGVLKTLDFSQLLSLSFLPPDEKKFPCLRLAREAMHAGGTAGAVYNAANEVAVARFLNNRLKFTDIASCIEHALEQTHIKEPENLEELIEVDKLTRQTTEAFASVR